jgi:hypothetical protein
LMKYFLFYLKFDILAYLFSHTFGRFLHQRKKSFTKLLPTSTFLWYNGNSPADNSSADKSSADNSSNTIKPTSRPPTTRPPTTRPPYNSPNTNLSALHLVQCYKTRPSTIKLVPYQKNTVFKAKTHINCRKNGSYLRAIWPNLT